MFILLAIHPDRPVSGASAFRRWFSVYAGLKKAAREVRKNEGRWFGQFRKCSLTFAVVNAFFRGGIEKNTHNAAGRREPERGVEIALRARRLRPSCAPLVEMIVGNRHCLGLRVGARMVLDDSLSKARLGVFIMYMGKSKAHAGSLHEDDAYSKASWDTSALREVLDPDRDVKDLPGAWRWTIKGGHK